MEECKRFLKIKDWLASLFIRRDFLFGKENVLILKLIPTQEQDLN